MAASLHISRLASCCLGISTVLMTASPVRSEPLCRINGTVESCRAHLVGDALTVVRADGSTIQTKRLGRCGLDQQDDGVMQRCNVRITLPDDFVYGLQLIKPQGAVELMAPTLTIELEGVSRSAET